MAQEGPVVWRLGVGFISLTSRFQKSRQLTETILKEYLREKLIVVCSVVLECVTILVINTVKHLVFSICHLFLLVIFVLCLSK